jgi:hypothetical protein
MDCSPQMTAGALLNMCLDHNDGKGEATGLTKPRPREVFLYTNKEFNQKKPAARKRSIASIGNISYLSKKLADCDLSNGDILHMHSPEFF